MSIIGMFLVRVVISMDGVMVLTLIVGRIGEGTSLGLEDQLLKMFSPYLWSPLQEILVNIHV